MRSGAAVAGLLLAILVTACRDEVEPPPVSGEVAPEAAPFGRVFVDVTREAGIAFRHTTGGIGRKYLPETLGSGVAIFDFDGDGRLDLFFVNGRPWSTADAPEAGAGRCALYRNLGGLRFEDVGAATGADVSVYGMGAAAADYDGDGDVDLYVTAVGDNVLLRNDGPTFVDVTATAGVAGGRYGDGHPEWSTAAAWGDFDGDGDLDLFVANYVEWTPEGEIFTTLDGRTKAFTTPDRYRGLPCRLFLNQGDGTFADASREWGLLDDLGKALGVVTWDFDDDGFLDVVVANDTRPNFCFANRDGRRFDEVGIEVGIAYDVNGRARAGMGIDVADYANDGVPAIAIGNFVREPLSLYRWRGRDGFESAASAAGLAAPTRDTLAFGVAFVDCDLDGLQDLVVVNGHIEPQIEQFQPGERYEQSALLLRGASSGVFRPVEGGPDFGKPRAGRGLAHADLDGDGDSDLVITTNGGAPVVLENRTAPGAREPRWLEVVLRGPPANRAALGATVTLVASGVRQIRRIRTGSSYLSQSETAARFGLGATDAIQEVIVTWPDGNVSRPEVTGSCRTVTAVR